MKFNILERLIAAQVFLCVVVCAALGFEPVCFRDKATDRVKRGCHRIMGKHDAFPRYECPDENEKPVSFDPGDRWEVIDGNDPLCKPRSRGSLEDDELRGDDESEKKVPIFPGCAPRVPEGG
ncbi:hypothetical protein QUF80_14905 [Desulfococcaceae bacterium HSG8]|nr:hypothetical protein [Desulfococcaceae bacterium HSG8]